MNNFHIGAMVSLLLSVASIAGWILEGDTSFAFSYGCFTAVGLVLAFVFTLLAERE